MALVGGVAAAAVGALVAAYRLRRKWEVAKSITLFCLVAIKKCSSRSAQPLLLLLH